jgi:hypothetical protein
LENPSQERLQERKVQILQSSAEKKSPRSPEKKSPRSPEKKSPKSPDGNKVNRAGLMDRAEQKRRRNGVNKFKIIKKSEISTDRGPHTGVEISGE